LNISEIVHSYTMHDPYMAEIYIVRMIY